MEIHALKDFLDEKYLLYNNKNFIESDPICIPHQFSIKQDIEIAGFLASTIAWGNRKSIIKNAGNLVRLMDNAPFDFITHARPKDYKPFANFVHRTFNGQDCIFFLQSLQNLYQKYSSLEDAFYKGIGSKNENVKNAIVHFRKEFFAIEHPERTAKHVSNPLKKSSAKRLCMFLRWMVRKDAASVDFGAWEKIKPAQLCLPLDVHTGNVSRSLELLKRNQNDWQAVEEITTVLKGMDSKDPVRYDFALFGLGAFEGFK